MSWMLSCVFFSAAGMGVVTLAAFESYQLNESQTYEHQVLLRARMVYSTSVLQKGLHAIRRCVLCRGRDCATRCGEVSKMHAKMRQHLAGKQSNVLDLKINESGITDIEFSAQYLVLYPAAEKNELTRWSDNVRIFELIVWHGIIDGAYGDGLRTSYTTLRDTLHCLALQGSMRQDNGSVVRPQARLERLLLTPVI